MSVRIGVRERASVVIVDIQGRLVLGDGPNELANLTRQLLEQGKKRILVNLAGVSRIDSTGLGALVGCYASGTTRGATVKMSNPMTRTRDLLVLTKLLTVFEVFDNEDDAVKSFEEVKTTAFSEEDAERDERPAAHNEAAAASQ